MTRQEIEACFLLAGIELYAATPVQNPYPGMQTVRGPIWLCDTTMGRFTVGYRKRVISIDWSEIGQFESPMPEGHKGTYTRYLHTDDVDQGATYIHAYSKPNVARYLAVFLDQAKTTRFVGSQS